MILSMIGFPEPKTLVKVIIALIPAVLLIIAITHHKQKVKFDLFARRYAIFLKVKELIAAIIIQRGMDEREIINKQVDTNEIRFLFDKKILRFINDIYRKNAELEKLKMEEHPKQTEDVNKKPELIKPNHSGNTDEQYQTIKDKQDEIIISFAGDFNRIDLIFAKYLKFKK